MKKVEELETQDFINSAKANQDVFLDHSTLISIENEDKSEQVTLTFSVGKDKIEVSIRNQNLKTSLFADHELNID